MGPGGDGPCQMTDNRDIAVEVVDLSKSYGSVVEVKALNLSIESGQYFVLLGHSGGGKTTLLAGMSASCRRTSGRPQWFFKAMRCSPT